LLTYELIGLSNILPQLFGYYIVQIGGPTKNADPLHSSSIHNRIIINPADKSTTSIQCNLDELPFLPESIDAILLFHILEFVKSPHTILKEVYNSIINGGHLVIFGFNPQSLWGITKIFKHPKRNIWNGHWLNPKKLRHSLLKIGFSVGDYQIFYFRPPNTNTKKMLFMEGLGQIFWPYCGASYMLVAKKTSTIITPLKKLGPLVRETVLVKRLPKPSGRVTQCNRNN
jgi:SAM-dependent methyltransferase